MGGLVVRLCMCVEECVQFPTDPISYVCMFPPFSSSFYVDDLIRNRMKPPPNWRHGFAEYISTLPSYYAQVCHCSCQCLSLVCHCSSQCLSLMCHCSCQCLSLMCHCSCQCLSQVPVTACVRICHRNVAAGLRTS